MAWSYWCRKKKKKRIQYPSPYFHLSGSPLHRDTLMHNSHPHSQFKWAVAFTHKKDQFQTILTGFRVTIWAWAEVRCSSSSSSSAPRGDGEGEGACSAVFITLSHHVSSLKAVAADVSAEGRRKERGTRSRSVIRSDSWSLVISLEWY